MGAVTAVVPTVQALVPVSLGAVELRADQSPVAVYLARLAPGSRRSMKQALEVMAGALSSGKADARAFSLAEAPVSAHAGREGLAG